MKQLMIILVMCSIQISTNFALKSKVGFDGINDISFSELKQQHNQSISVADWKLFHNHLDKQYYIKHASNHFKKTNYSEAKNKPFGVTPHRYVVQEEIKRLIEGDASAIKMLTILICFTVLLGDVHGTESLVFIIKIMIHKIVLML